MSFLNSKNQQNKPLRFAVVFLLLFLLFYFFNLWFFSRTNPGPHNIPFLAQHLNYIQSLRSLLLLCTSALLKCLGYSVIYNNYDLLVAGHAAIQVVYSCLGLGVISFFTAFVIAYPKPVKSKILLLFTGLLSIEFLNIIRFAILALWGNNANQLIDHHTLFNIIIYLLIAIGLYLWIKKDLAKASYGKN